jgi:hypothetical protein
MIKKRGRVVGLDVHPDSFAGAVVEGSDPASAQVLSSSTRVDLDLTTCLHRLVRCFGVQEMAEFQSQLSGIPKQ